MQISVTSNINETVGVLDRFSKQVPFAAAMALTKTAKQGADDMRSRFMSVFDNPTRYTIKSVFNSSANKRDLVAAFGVKDQGLLSKSGVNSPADVLGHHFNGGQSRMARYELAFRRLGMLGFNEDIVPASDLAELNQYGNVPASLIVKLISYFGGFSEQGYKANSTAETRAKMAKRTDKNTKGKTQSQYVKINGVVYFYASGRDHLHRGIWAKTGTHGSDIRPILMFVKRANYSKRFDINKFASKAVTDFNRNFNESWAYAVKTAR